MRAVRIFAVCMAVLAAGSVCGAAVGNGNQKPNLPARPGDVEAEWWGPNPGRAQRPIAQGEVKNVDPGRIELQTRLGVRQFVVDDKTRVVVRGQKASITDVRPGDVAVVKFQPVPNGNPVALGVLVPKPRVAGTIAEIDGTTMIVASPKGRERVTLTSETRIMSRGYVGSIADLRVGYEVAVGGDPSAAIFVEFIPSVAKGAVTAVNGDIITVKLVRQATLELQASPATFVLVRPRVGPNVKGTLADVRVGAPVNVGFHQVQGGPSPLLWIDVLTGM